MIGGGASLCSEFANAWKLKTRRGRGGSLAGFCFRLVIFNFVLPSIDHIHYECIDVMYRPIIFGWFQAELKSIFGCVVIIILCPMNICTCAQNSWVLPYSFERMWSSVVVSHNNDNTNYNSSGSLELSYISC